MKPTESFNLRWDDFETNACGALKELRNEGEFCDVTLACDGKQVTAHKVVLAGGSKFFKQILKQNPHPHPLLYLKGVRYEYLLSMLDFVYTGEANINEKELTAFLDVANDLQIKGLIEKIPSTKEGETITKNVSHEDGGSVGPLLQVKTPSPSQSTFKEGPIDAPFDIHIKIELDDINPSTAVFGVEESPGDLNDGENMMAFKTNVPNSYEISGSINNGPMTADCSEQSQDFTSPDQLVACQQKTDLPFNQREFSDPNSKSKCEENYDRNQVLVKDNVKNKTGEASSFNVNLEQESYVKRDDFLKGVDHNDEVLSDCDMDEYGWYEDDEKYTSVSVRHDEEGNGNHNDETFSTMKKGKKVCSICGKSFRDNFALKGHMQSHTGEKPFQCMVCFKRFSRSDKLNLHKKQCVSHDGETEENNKDEEFSTMKKGSNICSVRGKSNQSNFARKSHMRTHTGEKPFSCGVCHKTFDYSSQLKRHTMSHTGEKPFLCAVCSKTFAYSNALKEHTKIHTGEKPFLCRVCPKTFALSSNLKKHRRIHTGEKPFSCEVCCKTFTQSNDLKNHTRVHTGEKPYSCKVCSKTFSSSSHFKDHTRIHNGEKPYQCSLCFKRFIRSDTQKDHQKRCSMNDLKKHTRVHTGEKTFPCKVCHKAFSSSTQLTRHTRIHTGEKPYQCSICFNRFIRSDTLKLHKKQCSMKL